MVGYIYRYYWLHFSYNTLNIFISWRHTDTKVIDRDASLTDSAFHINSEHSFVTYAEYLHDIVDIYYQNIV